MSTLNLPSLEELVLPYVEQYKSATLRVALKHEKDGFQIMRGMLLFNLNNKNHKKEEYDYTSFILLSKTISVESALNIIRSLLDGKPIPDLSIENTWKFEIEYPYYSRKNMVIPFGEDRVLEWPSRQFIVIENNKQVNYPESPIIMKDLPIIVNTIIDINKWICPNIQNRNEYRPSLHVIVPDYRARIDQITISDNSLNVNVLTEKITEENIVMKAKMNYLFKDMEIDLDKNGSEYKLAFNEIPDRICLFVIDKSNWEVIDWVDINLNDLSSNPRIQIDMGARYVNQIIADGENSTVEFKEDLDMHKFIQTVVAFANSGEGFILIGVADDSTIKGCDVKRCEEKTKEWIEQYCEPPITPTYYHVPYDSTRNLLVIRITKGDNPPYFHRNNGIPYVRRGSTDRPMKRVEMDSYYNQKTIQPFRY